MSKPDYKDPAVFDKNLKVIDDLLHLLLSFLQDGTTVTIKNSDFIACFK
jgi:hypothetical protein